MTDPMTTWLVTGLTFVFAWIILRVVRFIPKGLVHVFVLPALGTLANYLMSVFASSDVNPWVAVLAGIAAGGIHKFLEHGPEMLKYIASGVTPPMADKSFGADD